MPRIARAAAVVAVLLAAPVCVTSATALAEGIGWDGTPTAAATAQLTSGIGWD